MIRLATRISVVAIATLALLSQTTAQVPVPGKAAGTHQDLRFTPQLKLTNSAKKLTISDGTLGLPCIVLIGLRDRSVPGSDLRIEPLAILAQGDFDGSGEFGLTWPKPAVTNPITFKVQAVGPIDAKGAKFSRVATLRYDGNKVAEVGS